MLRPVCNRYYDNRIGPIEKLYCSHGGVSGDVCLDVLPDVWIECLGVLMGASTGCPGVFAGASMSGRSSGRFLIIAGVWLLC